MMMITNGCRLNNSKTLHSRQARTNKASLSTTSPQSWVYSHLGGLSINCIRTNISLISFGWSFCWWVKAGFGFLTILGPLILASDLLFLLGGKVVCDVERLSDLLGRLALDHIRHGLTTNIEEGFYVKIVGCLEDSEVSKIVLQETSSYGGPGWILRTRMISKSIS